jgi:16S rRNA (cytidine1402-2'-O)-methyltransferase
VRAAIEAGIPVVPIPGASALLAALVAAGIDAGEFTFLGFLPRKGGERRQALAVIADSPRTVVLYEAANRVADTLRTLAAAGTGAREVVVAREMTKQFEEFRRGTASELAEYYDRNVPRGEAVIVVAGRPPVEVDEEDLRTHAARLRAEGASTREIVRLLVEEHHASRNVAYRIAHE